MHVYQAIVIGPLTISVNRCGDDAIEASVEGDGPWPERVQFDENDMERLIGDLRNLLRISRGEI